MDFFSYLRSLSWEKIHRKIQDKTPTDVEIALNKETITPEDLMSLLSPAATTYLSAMAEKSAYLTRKRFGKTIQLYIPLYLSNYCENHCSYCGFNLANPIHRSILSDEQILQEVHAIKTMGYEHVLLVSGESTKAGAEYFNHVIQLIRPYFSLISIEVQPLSTEAYTRLITSGLHSVYLYQETYNESSYAAYHPKGKKADFKRRIDSYENLGQAEIYKTGMGILLGLEDWRSDAYFLAMHLAYMRKKYWKTKYSVSFPRLRPQAGNFSPPYPVSEHDLLQLITAFRLFDEDVEITLSTRESASFRDLLLPYGITSMSAGSSTSPGGYACANEELRQFEIDDNRSPEEIAHMIRSCGFEVVWKDWDAFMQV